MNVSISSTITRKDPAQMPISRGHEERRRTREPSRIGWSSSRLPIDPQVLAPVASVIEPRLHPECYRDTPKMALRALLDLAIEIPAILLRSMPHALATTTEQ
jgi:hypothetical protein